MTSWAFPHESAIPVWHNRMFLVCCPHFQHGHYNQCWMNMANSCIYHVFVSCQHSPKGGYCFHLCCHSADTKMMVYHVKFRAVHVASCRAWNFPCYFRILWYASGVNCGNDTDNSKPCSCQIGFELLVLFPWWQDARDCLQLSQAMVDLHDNSRQHRRRDVMSTRTSWIRQSAGHYH